MTEQDFMLRHFTKVNDEAEHEMNSDCPLVPEVSVNAPVSPVGPGNESTRAAPKYFHLEGFDLLW